MQNVRVYDLHRGQSLQWEFVECGTEDLAAGVTERLPPATNLVAETFKNDPALRNLAPEYVAPPAAAPRLPQPELAAAHVEEGPTPPDLQPPRVTQPHPLEFVPETAVEDFRLPNTTAAAANAAFPARAAPALPPGYDLAIEAPVPALPAAQDPAFGAAEEPAFDYYTLSQMSPAVQADPDREWAAGLAMPQETIDTVRAAAMGPMHNNININVGNGNRLQFGSPPLASVVQRRAAGFALPPDEAAARRVRLQALQAELGSIWRGDGEGERAAGTAAAGGGAFTTTAAAAAAALPAAAFGSAAAVEVQGASGSGGGGGGDLSASWGPSTEVMSPEAAEQLEAVEAAALAGKAAAGAPQRGTKRPREEIEEESVRHRQQQQQPLAGVVCSGPLMPPGPPGFITASRRPIAVSEDRLAAARQLLEADGSNSLPPAVAAVTEGPPAAMYTEPHFIPPTEAPNFGAPKGFHRQPGGAAAGLPPPPPFAGFKTLTGRALEVSARALEAGRRLLNHSTALDQQQQQPLQNVGEAFPATELRFVPPTEEETPAALQLAATASRPLSPPPPPAFSGFTTLTGKRLQPTAQGMEAGRRLLADADDAAGAGAAPAEPVGGFSEIYTEPQFFPPTEDQNPLGSGGTGGGGFYPRLTKRHPNEPAPAFEGLKTLTGRKLEVSAARLEAGRRLLDGGNGDADSEMQQTDTGLEGPTEPQFVPETEATTPGGFYDHHASAAAAAVAAAERQPAFVGFKTLNGKKMEVSARGMEAGRLLLADSDQNPAAAAVPRGPQGGGDGDTPCLRKQVLRSRLPAGTPPGIPHAFPNSNAPARPSRLGPYGGQGRPIAQQQQHPPADAAGTAARKGRVRFATPRPFKPPAATPGAGAGAAGGSASVTPRGAVILQRRTSSTPLHDLASSALKAALASVDRDTPPQQQQQQFMGPPDWPSRLPLDSISAAEHRFSGSDGKGGDAGWEAMRDTLLQAGAVPEYASEDWVRNHYRWVVCKLARAEFAAGPAAAGRILTAAAAEDELRRRYEREHNRGGRPFLKAVLQHDESSSGLCVLMVASIRRSGGGGDNSTPHAKQQCQQQQQQATLELTDGWYWVMAVCDEALTQQVWRGHIFPGCKLRVTGAELSGSPGDPVVAARSSMLKLHANGTHPAPFDAKLGRLRNQLSYLPLSAVVPGGGVVPRTVLVVLRRYARLLWTRLPSGVSTFQTPRAQAAAERRLQEELSRVAAVAEAIVQAAEAQRCREWLRQGKSGGMTPVERRYAAAVVGEVDATQLQPAEQVELERYAARRREELAAEAARAREDALAADMPAAVKAGSTEAAMLLVGEICHGGTQQGRLLARNQRQPAMALVTVWRPGEEVSAIKEGEVWEVAGLEPSESRQQRGCKTDDASQEWCLLPDAVPQLSTGPRTLWSRISPSVDKLPARLAGQGMPRVEPKLCEMAVMGAAVHDNGQRSASFDFTGLILRVGPVYTQTASSQYPQYQWVFLADDSVTESDGGGAAGAEAAHWLLAVRLVGPRDAVRWVTPEEEGEVVSAKDLELVGQDDAARMWRATGGKHSAVNVGLGGGGRGRQASEQAKTVAAWAVANPEAVEKMRARVNALMGT